MTKVNVSLKELEKPARAEAKEAGVTLAAWITGLVAKELGKPVPNLGRGLASTSKRTRTKIAKQGAKALHSQTSVAAMEEIANQYADPQYVKEVKRRSTKKAPNAKTK